MRHDMLGRPSIITFLCALALSGCGGGSPTAADSARSEQALVAKKPKTFPPDVVISAADCNAASADRRVHTHQLPHPDNRPDSHHDTFPDA